MVEVGKLSRYGLHILIAGTFHCYYSKNCAKFLNIVRYLTKAKLRDGCIYTSTEAWGFYTLEEKEEGHTLGT